MPATNLDTLIATGLPVKDNVLLPTIATTGTQEATWIAPYAGTLTAAVFVAKDVLAANDTNYVTFAITNKQAGAGAVAMLAATDANTTKATGGTALAAYTKRTLTVNGTAANLVVAAGDVLSITVAATGTLANTVTVPRVQLSIRPT